MAKLNSLKTLFLTNNDFKGNYASLQEQLPSIINLDIDEKNTRGTLVTLDIELDDEDDDE